MVENNHPAHTLWLYAVLGCAAILTSAAHAEDWPQFRGPGARGIGSSAPESWDVPGRVGVKWKTPVPGLGHSSPVIWGDRLYLTTAVGVKDEALQVGLYGDIASVEDDSVHRWLIMCFDLASGEILWTREGVSGVPRIKRHTKATHANSTPATDGKHVVTFFGSEGLFCFDMDGTLRWKKDLGELNAGFFLVPSAQWGFGSSPVIHDGRVIVQCDVQGQSFVAAFDVESGREIWRTDRDEVPTWGTPTVAARGDGLQVIVNGWKHIGGYDFETGNELWKLRGGGDIPVPTPIVHHALAFITNAHGRMSPMYAVRLSASGDITPEEGVTSNEHIAWSEPNGGAYMQTPLALGEYLYSCRDNGVLTCYRAATGEVMYRQRLGGGRTGFTASAVAGGGLLYYTAETGDVYVVRAGPNFELLGVHSLGETCLATPAIAEGVIYFRTRRHVIAVGK